jgi:hypothetical protein
MDTVEEFIYGHEGKQREILLYFHNLLLSFPMVTVKFQYKLPFYYRKTWFCYLHPTKNGKVELSFIRGRELADEHGLLDFKNRKKVGSIPIRELSDITPEIHALIQEALLLDETTPYKFNRNKNK